MSWNLVLCIITTVVTESVWVRAGEGGAGTWSDGKLTTKVGRNSDPVRRVLHTLHAFGAPQVETPPPRRFRCMIAKLIKQGI